MMNLLWKLSMITVIWLSILVSVIRLDAACVKDNDCIDSNLYCLNAVCQSCINCQEKFRREQRIQVNCSTDVSECGACAPGYMEVVDANNETSDVCLPNSENENMVNENDKYQYASGWIVFGFGILGALVGFILGAVVTIAMAIWQRKRRQVKLKNKKKWGYDSVSEKRKCEISSIRNPEKTETLNSVGEENGLLSDSNDEGSNRNYNLPIPSKKCSTFQQLLHSNR